MQFSHNTSVACWRGKFIILRIGADLVRNHQSPIFRVSSILPSRVARIETLRKGRSLVTRKRLFRGLAKICL